MNALTANELRELLDYDSDSGIFRWKKKLSIRVTVGGVAGGISVWGYRTIALHGKTYRAARLAWLYTYGRWPTKQIDHKNGVRDDDRIENLREVTSRQNAQNKRKHRSGKLPGCYKQKGSHVNAPWQASIRVDGKGVYLGNFPTEQEAHDAYIRALDKIGEEPVATKASA